MKAQEYCECSLEEMLPVRDLNNVLGDKHCDVCQGIVTWGKNDQYNRHYGYSGYDEYNDEYESDCDRCEDEE